MEHMKTSWLNSDQKSSPFLNKSFLNIFVTINFFFFFCLIKTLPSLTLPYKIERAYLKENPQLNTWKNLQAYSQYCPREMGGTDPLYSMRLARQPGTGT